MDVTELYPQHKINYEMLPVHMQEGTKNYVEKGYRPGGFLFAVLSNNLTDAYTLADLINRQTMEQWARWLTNEAPVLCWGDPQTVLAWVAFGGLYGIQTRKDQAEQMEELTNG